MNTFGEEAKQITYAHRMGFGIVNDGSGRWPVYDMDGKSVLDIGGGPVSILLKCVNVENATVVDPCVYPKWTRDRYRSAGIKVVERPAEDYRPRTQFDEVWIYNCLQHTIDPEKIVRQARQYGEVLRMFEWLETPACEGHPHTLHADELNEWVGGGGHIENVNENGAVGLAWYGVFV